MKKSWSSEATRVLSSARDRISVLAQAGNVARNGVLGHFSRLIHRPPVGYATWQRRDERGVAALRFGPEHDVVVVARLGHGTDTIVLRKPGQTHEKPVRSRDDPITRWPDILPPSPRQDMMSANERLAPWRTVNISQKSWKV